jgi:hypothetical protein
VASYTATGTAFDDIPVDGHRETWPISNRFRNWVAAVASTKTRTEMTVDFSSK